MTDLRQPSCAAIERYLELLASTEAARRQCRIAAATARRAIAVLEPAGYSVAPLAALALKYLALAEAMESQAAEIRNEARVHGVGLLELRLAWVVSYARANASERERAELWGLWDEVADLPVSFSAGKVPV